MLTRQLLGSSIQQSIGQLFAHEPTVSSGVVEKRTMSGLVVVVHCVPKRKSATAMATTKTMCHQTDRSLRKATTRMPPMLRTNWTSIRTPMVTTWPEMGPKVAVLKVPPKILSMIVPLMKAAAAKLMPATMAIWPPRLSQAVHQPQSLFFILLAQ